MTKFIILKDIAILYLGAYAKELRYSKKVILQKDSLYLASKEEFYKVIKLKALIC